MPPIKSVRHRADADYATAGVVLFHEQSEGLDMAHNDLRLDTCTRQPRSAESHHTLEGRPVPGHPSATGIEILDLHLHSCDQ
jgi:hypothetical protein